MGIYIYTLRQKRNIKGLEVYKAHYSQRMSNTGWDSEEARARESKIWAMEQDRFEDKPLFVFDFKHLEKVYKKADTQGYFYDCAKFGEHYGWLMKVGRSYQVVTVDELDAHVRSMSVFKDFKDLIRCTGSHYRPTISKRGGSMNVVLADIFDDHYNETGPWINPENGEVSPYGRGRDPKTSQPWKAQTQAYRG